MHRKVPSIDHGPTTDETTLVLPRELCWGVRGEELEKIIGSGPYGTQQGTYRFSNCPDNGLDGAAVLSPFLDLYKTHTVGSTVYRLRRMRAKYLSNDEPLPDASHILRDAFAGIGPTSLSPSFRHGRR